MRCPHPDCNADIHIPEGLTADDIGVCPECGRPLDLAPHGTQEQAAAPTVCELCGAERIHRQGLCATCWAKVLQIAGAQTGSSSLSDSVINRSTIIQTVIEQLTMPSNGEQHRASSECAICGKVLGAGVIHYHCKCCDSYVCEEHFLTEKLVCVQCAETGAGEQIAEAFEEALEPPVRHGGFVVAVGKRVRAHSLETLEIAHDFTVKHSPRSVCQAVVAGETVILAGWRLGVFVLAPEDGRPVGEFHVPAAAIKEVYGTHEPRAGTGFNCVAVHADNVFATHSELGAWRWPIDTPTAGRPFLDDAIRNIAARHVGPVRIEGSAVFVAADRRVFSADASGQLRGAAEFPEDVLDFQAIGGQLIAVTCDSGRLLRVGQDEEKPTEVSVEGGVAALTRLDDGQLLAIGPRGALWRNLPDGTRGDDLGAASVGSGEVVMAAANGDVLGIVIRRTGDSKSRLVMWDMRHRRALGAEGGAEGVSAGRIRDIAAWRQGT